jgi:hypothetical protein
MTSTTSTIIASRLLKKLCLQYPNGMTRSDEGRMFSKVPAEVRQEARELLLARGLAFTETMPTSGCPLHLIYASYEAASQPMAGLVEMKTVPRARAPVAA